MAQLFTLAFEDTFTENTAANDQTEDEPSTYEMLEMALTACHPAHPLIPRITVQTTVRALQCQRRPCHPENPKILQILIQTIPAL